MRLAFDIETDGLLPELTKVHSLVIRDLDTNVQTSCADQPGYVPVEVGVKMLMAAQMVVGHNIIGFDLLALAKVFPWFRFGGIAVDTLILGRLVFPDIKKQIDFALQKKGKLPGHLMGRHSLEAWGYRIGNFKGEYTDWCKANGIADPWAQWRPEMQTYGEQDVDVTVSLLRRLIRRMESQQWRSDAVELEHNVARIILRQIDYGFGFDEKAARALHVKLVAHRERLEADLQVAFPPRIVETAFVPKVNNKKMGYVKGETFIKKKLVVFNPSSRAMIAERLKSKYAWEPDEFTDSGQPKIDEGTLEGLPWPEAKLLNEYLMVDKRLSALAEGKQAWLVKVGKDARMHGNVNPMGAATSRMTHNGPNVGQVPSVDVPYGKECRALFGASRPGYVLVGCDADALELRCLAHRMAKHDGGAYIETVLKGDKALGTDMHSVNARALGLDPKATYSVGALQLPGREIAKTFFYAFIYGAGAEKLGTILGKSGRQAIMAGVRLKASFLKGLPALGKLIEQLAGKVQQGFIRGLDGRVIPLRSAHAALNTLLQSDGAILMKRALVILDASLAREGLHFGDDYEFVANVHDEYQLEVKQEHAEKVGQLAVEAIREAGRYYNFRCPLDGQFKVGRNWADTH